jgi:BirA family biotin operon repressor/biotin-[acetyl-CoA-carboxylase] ligase
MPTFLSRRERFTIVGSTNDVVRAWLDSGTPEVCLAVADEQSAGRGRAGRSWYAPRGGGLLLSLGFRPIWLSPGHAWRLAALTSLAMAGAGEEVAGLRPRAISLKWPNDLFAAGRRGPAKVAGVLGETDGLGTHDPRAIIGIGVNGDWREADFPDLLAAGMTSLREAGGGHPLDHGALLESFVERLQVAVNALRAGRYDSADWMARQLTTGRLCTLEYPDSSRETVMATGVDADSGALLVESRDDPGDRRAILSGEIRHVRVAGQPRIPDGQPGIADEQELRSPATVVGAHRGRTGGEV